MSRLIPAVLAAFALFIALGPWLDVPAKDSSRESALPVGKWKVEFANGVVEECRIGNGGEAYVEEPRRRSGGNAVAQDGAVVVTSHDDRVERWTPVGRRFVVEHWFPGSRVPTGTPVLGIAEGWD